MLCYCKYLASITPGDKVYNRASNSAGKYIINQTAYVLTPLGQGYMLCTYTPGRGKQWQQNCQNNLNDVTFALDKRRIFSLTLYRADFSSMILKSP